MKEILDGNLNQPTSLQSFISEDINTFAAFLQVFNSNVFMFAFEQHNILLILSKIEIINNSVGQL